MNSVNAAVYVYDVILASLLCVVTEFDEYYP